MILSLIMAIFINGPSVKAEGLGGIERIRPLQNVNSRLSSTFLLKNRFLLLQSFSARQKSLPSSFPMQTSSGVDKEIGKTAANVYADIWSESDYLGKNYAPQQTPRLFACLKKISQQTPDQTR